MLRWMEEEEQKEREWEEEARLWMALIVEKEDFDLNSKHDWKPVELLKDWGDVMELGGFGDKTRSWILNYFKLTESFVRQTKVTVISLRDD